MPFDADLINPFRFVDLRFRIAFLANSIPLSETMQVEQPSILPGESSSRVHEIGCRHRHSFAAPTFADARYLTRN